MKFTDVFVNRPVLSTVLSLLILLVGLRSLALLELREYPRADRAVVMITTEGGETMVQTAMESGANGYVTKPFTPDSIRQALAEFAG